MLKLLKIIVDINSNTIFVLTKQNTQWKRETFTTKQKIYKGLI